ncbi:MAG: RsmE family RNA methyltransferase [Candidatus Omnitrophica bacterium]|jgi:16S rRNA (uracil1498-N3)-methyltransferase|nr:RsmE family RNA methyltransferase [Candidatus Omnitrophota bacterium]
MRRFFIDERRINGNEVILSGQEARHITNVIRLRPGDRFTGIDGKGRLYTLRVETTGRDVCACIEKISSQPAVSADIVLACAIPKKFGMDDIVEKATQLGVSGIIPMITERTIVRPAAKAIPLKRERWKRIAVEACKQSQRATLPEIYDIMDLPRALDKVESLGCVNRIMPFVAEGLAHISDIPMRNKKSAAVFIGPEGDFTGEEIDLAIKLGFNPVSLGSLVLKVDTACYYSLSVISSRLLNVK